MQKIRTCGEDLEGVAVKRTERHFYTVSVRTRPVNREYQSERAAGKRGGERR
jgi:ribosomal protein L34E